MNNKLKYLITCIRKRIFNTGKKCPSCGNSQSEYVDSKYIITQLRRCKKCKLLFRTPTTTEQENYSFYQKDYEQGFTTALPDKNTLSSYIKENFCNSDRDYSTYIDVLRALKVNKQERLFDFGCSWGYGSWQIRNNGFDVESFEISEKRAEYAVSELGLHVHRTFPSEIRPVDMFFSCHVLEHVPSVYEVIKFGFRILKPGGYFVAFTPNGSFAHRQKNSQSWKKLWGSVHPNFIDDVFYKHEFSGLPYLLSSYPYDINAIETWTRNTNKQVILDLGGFELLLIAQKQV